MVALLGEYFAGVYVSFSPHFCLSMSLLLSMFVALCIHAPCVRILHGLSWPDAHIFGPHLQIMFIFPVLRSGCKIGLAAFAIAPILSAGIVAPGGGALSPAKFCMVSANSNLQPLPPR